MRLTRISIENFRAYRQKTTIEISELTSIIGRNDIGKSTILEAMEIFFNNEVVKIDQGDRNVHTGAKLARISCEFDNFNDTIVLDAENSTSLVTEHLLNAEGRLEIVKSWDLERAAPKAEVYARALHPNIEKVADLLQLKQAALKQRVKELAIDTANIDQRINAQLRQAIRGHFVELDLKVTEVPLNAEEGRKVWEQLEKQLPTFALFQSDRRSKDDDPEVQDPMALAVKEAMKDLQPQLDDIRREVEKKAVEVAQRTLAKLQEMDPELAADLSPVFKSEPKWEGFKLSLNSDHGIPVNKRGSGVRRLVLLNFFRAEAERRQQEHSSPNVIYAIEEPENSQHPDNQAMLVKALLELSKQENTQVLLTTHVPGIAGMLPQDSIRFVSRGQNGAPQVEAGSDDVLAKVADTLGVTPDNRAKVLVYVEGPHDVTFLQHMNALLRSQHHNLIDCVADQRVAFVLVGGGNVKHWVNKRYLQELGRAEVHIYDRDDAQNPKYLPYVTEINARGDGSWARLTTKREMENFIHQDVILSVFNATVVVTDECDVPTLVAEQVHAAASPNPWADLEEKTKSSKSSRAKQRLNAECAAQMTYAHLKQRDPTDEILGWFQEITRRANA